MTNPPYGKRKIGNKWYYLFEWYPSKSSANTTAKKIRATSILARVIKKEFGWEVYIAIRPELHAEIQKRIK